MRIFLAVTLICASFVTSAEVLKGRVVSVSDGDTFRLITAEGKRTRIRIEGIDAPERTQPYSEVSRRNLGELIQGQLVTIEWHKSDKYGRPVAVVRAADGRDIGLEQIKAGLAWHFKRYELEQTPEDRAAYGAAEAIAKAARRGLWREESPVPPWEFRAKQRIPEVERP